MNASWRDVTVTLIPWARYKSNWCDLLLLRAHWWCCSEPQLIWPKQSPYTFTSTEKIQAWRTSSFASEHRIWKLSNNYTWVGTQAGFWIRQWRRLLFFLNTFPDEDSEFLTGPTLTLIEVASATLLYFLNIVLGDIAVCSWIWGAGVFEQVGISWTGPRWVRKTVQPEIEGE